MNLYSRYSKGIYDFFEALKSSLPHNNQGCQSVHYHWHVTADQHSQDLK